MEPMKAPPRESPANLMRQTAEPLGVGTNAFEGLGLGFGLVSISESESGFGESVVAIALSLSVYRYLIPNSRRISNLLLYKVVASFSYLYKRRRRL